MSTLNELIHYCNERNPIGAMLLTGEWGCGKSYLIEHDLTRALEHTHLIVRVSLFGITDAGTLLSTVRQKWFETCTPILGQIRKAKQKSSGFLTAFNTALRALNPLAGDAANVMVSMNMLDLLPIKSEVEDSKTLEKKRVILVYDDLERTKIDPVELLGLINDFCENQNFNTIIVSESNEVLKRMMREDPVSYHMLREKTISQSLRYIPDFPRILHSILEKRTWPTADYAEYLSSHEALILDAFASDSIQSVKSLLETEDGKYHNLRTLTKGMESFYRIYYHMNGAEIPIPDSRLYSFLAYYLAHKSGIRKNGELVLEFDDDDLTRFYPGYSPKELTESEKKWILSGVWDKNVFRAEIGAPPLPEQHDEADGDDQEDEEAGFSGLFRL